MKNQHKLTVSTLIFSLLAGCFTPIQAVDHLQFNTIRHMGMGGVGIAQTFDATALYTNPAGLFQAHSEIKLPLRLRADINTFTLTHQSDIQYLLATHTQTEKLHKIDSFSLPYTIAAKAAATPGFSWIHNNIGIGLFAQGNVFTKISNPVVPEVDIQGYSDISPMIGYATSMEIGDTPISVGGTLRYIMRTRIVDPATGTFSIHKQAADFIDSASSFEISQTTMSGIGGDLGALMPLGSGQLGMVLYNIGSELKGNTPSGNAVKETLPMHLGFGYAQELDAANMPVIGELLGKWAAEIDVKFQHHDIYKNVYMGAEKKFLDDTVSLRAGLSQGYPSIGIGIDAWILHLNYAYYTEEMGEKVGDNPQSYHALEVGFLF